MAWFSDIPLHNQMDVLKKLNFKEFVRFKKCSRETKEICDRFRHRLPLECYEATIEEDRMKLELTYIYEDDGCNLECAFDEPIHLNVDNVIVRSTTSKGMEIEEIVRRSGLTARKLEVNKEKKNLNSATIDRLLRVLKASELRMFYYSSQELLQLEELKNLRGIYFNGAVMQDSIFLQLQAQKITVWDGVFSSDFVAKYLEQWREGKRKIECLDIPVNMTIFSTVADFDPIELWDKSDDSLPYSHIELMENEYGDLSLTSVYLLNREEDNKRLIIGIGYYEGWKMLACELEEDDDIEEWITGNYMFS